MSDWRELACRHTDGLEVRLVWSKATDRVRVTVLDTKGGGSFDIDVSGAEALSAFYHPFAYSTAASPVALASHSSERSAA
jgi:hypothetical protein